MQELMGYTYDELIGKKFYNFIGALEDVETVKKNIKD